MTDEAAKLRQELNNCKAWLLGAYCWLAPNDRHTQLASLPKDLVRELKALANRDKVTLDHKDGAHTSGEILLASRLNAFIRVAEDILEGRKHGG